MKRQNNRDCAVNLRVRVSIIPRRMTHPVGWMSMDLSQSNQAVRDEMLSGLTHSARWNPKSQWLELSIWNRECGYHADILMQHAVEICNALDLSLFPCDFVKHSFPNAVWNYDH